MKYDRKTLSALIAKRVGWAENSAALVQLLNDYEWEAQQKTCEETREKLNKLEAKRERFAIALESIEKDIEELKDDCPHLDYEDGQCIYCGRAHDAV